MTSTIHARAINSDDIEAFVVADLLKQADILLAVLHRDSTSALSGDPTRFSDLNTNFRTLSAINEVLVYYGHEGVFAEGML